MKYLLIALSLLITTTAHAENSAQYETKYTCGNIACDLECVSEAGQPEEFSKKRLNGEVTLKLLENGYTVIELKEVQNGGRTETWTLPAGTICKIL